MLLYSALKSKAKGTSDRAWIENMLKAYRHFVYSYVWTPYAFLKAHMGEMGSEA